MATNPQIRRALEIQLRAQRLIQTTENAAARQLARVIDATIARVLEIVQSGGSGTALMDAIDIVLSVALNDGADTMVAMADDIFGVAVTSTAEALEVFGVASADALAASAFAFDSQFRADLLTEGHAAWYDALSETALRPVSGLSNAVREASLEGRSAAAAAKEWVKNDPMLSDLPPLERQMAARWRAERVIRTESTRIDNVISTSFAESAGVTEFINVGIGDGSQSDICREATRSMPMSLADWNRSPWGTAPRHPNCRCKMLGVPREFEASDQLLGELGVLSG